ncbi:MAG: response regulator [Pseudonocardiales bacterium]
MNSLEVLVPTAGDCVHILVADDHTLVREAIRDMLMAQDDFWVVGEAADDQAVVEQAARLRPHVVLVDIAMLRNKPPEIVRKIRCASSSSKIVILSMHDELHIIREMVDSGVSGYLPRSADGHALVAAIRTAHQTDLSAGRHVVNSVPGEALTRHPVPSSAVSAREREVLILVAAGLSNRQVAGRLSITEATVKRHLRNTFEKLHAVSRIDAVNKATAAGLIGSWRHGYLPVPRHPWPGAEAARA